MNDSLHLRVTVILACLCLLVGLSVWLGSVEPDPANNHYPGPVEIEENPEEFVGERVSVGGTVVDTNPLTIGDDGRRFVVESVDRTVSVDDGLVVYGTFRADGSLETIEMTHVEPWERQYMFLVSGLGGLWVLGRLLNRWTIDTTDWALVPRSEPLVCLG